MKEQFDKRLVEKIKGSFENYDEPFDPKEWEKFSDVYFDNKKPKSLWLWTTLITGVAASLIIGFLIWPSMVGTVDEEYVSYDQELPKGVEESAKRELSIADDDLKETRQKRESDQKVARPDRQVDSSVPIAEVPSSRNYSAIAIASANLSKDIKREGDAARAVDADIESVSILDLPELKKLEMAEVHHREKDPEVLQPASNPMALQQTLDLQSKDVAVREQLKEEEAQKIINTWAMADLPAQKDKEKRDGRGVKWGLVMAPQAVSNTTMGLNLGGGVMSEISLGKRLKLDVGVTFARQSLVPGQGQNVAMVMHNSPANPSGDQLQSAAFGSPYRASPLMAANMIAPVNPVYELNFANLDIPINLKYKVMDNPQSGLYLISGLSSMIYLSQSSSETFNFSHVVIGQANAFTPNQVQTFTTEVSPQDGESNVDLARMLNLSFGYEYKLSNGTFFSVEPFYKMPIGNMTFVDQQFSIGGVNLRMNFQFKK